MTSSPLLPNNQLPVWPLAYPETHTQAGFKQEYEDFQVLEIPLNSATGEGEHVWLEVTKQGANTAWVAAQIAEFAGVQAMDVGYAGLKDRYAITKQWFSIYLPRVQEPDFSQINNEEFQVLQQTRSSRKLRRGDLLGNRFIIRLREINGDLDAVEDNLNKIVKQGVPNYFGAQRFGHHGQNIEQGRAMLAREIRVRNRTKKGLYLSSIRSFIFNEILARRIENDCWWSPISGDHEMVAAQPSGPLWGRGRSVTAADAAVIEQAVVQQYPELCQGLEHAGLNQERRSFVTFPEALKWQWIEPECAHELPLVSSSQRPSAGQDLVLSFTLPAGHYATSVLREIAHLIEPTRENHDDFNVVK